MIIIIIIIGWCGLVVWFRMGNGRKILGAEKFESFTKKHLD